MCVYTRVRERGSAPKRGGHSTKCICAVEPGHLTIHTEQWFLGAGFIGAPPISLIGCKSIRPISVLILSLLRFVDSELPGGIPYGHQNSTPDTQHSA